MRLIGSSGEVRGLGRFGNLGFGVGGLGRRGNTEKGLAE